MIIGKRDKNRIKNIQITHMALVDQICREAEDCAKFLAEDGKSQRRKLEAMPFFAKNLITMCNRSKEAIKNDLFTI